MQVVNVVISEYGVNIRAICAPMAACAISSRLSASVRLAGLELPATNGVLRFLNCFHLTSTCRQVCPWICLLSDKTSATAVTSHKHQFLADRTAIQYDRLLASSCRPSVRLSVCLSVCLSACDAVHCGLRVGVQC